MTKSFHAFFESNFWRVFTILAKLYTSSSFKDSARHGNRRASAAAASVAACERKASLDPLGLPPKQQQQQPSGQAKKNRARPGEVAKRTS